MGVAVVGQLVLPWSSASPPFQDTWPPAQGLGGAGSGAWALYIPASHIILGSFNIIY